MCPDQRSATEGILFIHSLIFTYQILQNITGNGTGTDHTI